MTNIPKTKALVLQIYPFIGISLSNTLRGVLPYKATRLTQYPVFCVCWTPQISLSTPVYPGSAFWKTSFGNHDRATDTALNMM